MTSVGSPVENVRWGPGIPREPRIPAVEHGHRNTDRQWAAQKGSVAEYYTAVQPQPPESVTTPRSIAPTGGSVKPGPVWADSSGAVRGPTEQTGCERLSMRESISDPRVARKAPGATAQA